MSRYPLLAKAYFALALIGFVWSWFFFVQYFASADSVLLGPFLKSAMSNPASSGVAIDAYVAGIVFSVMVLTSASADAVKWPWLYVVITFLIGLCVSLPLYLGFKELEKST